MRRRTRANSAHPLAPARALGLLALATAFGSLPVPAPLHAQSGLSYIYLIDTSGSMEGLPAGSGNAVIFPRVKEELLRHLEDMEAGEQVEIRTFDAGIQSRAVFDMASPADRREATRFVEGLEARGQSTWVYRSILDAARDRRSGAESASPAAYYVFTDGVDNDPEGASMREMLDQFGELRRENDYLIYVTLGVDLPASDSAAFEDREWGELRKQPPGVLRLGVVQLRARHLDFGLVEGDVSGPRSLALRLRGVEPDSVRLNISPSFPEIEAAGGVVEPESIVTDFDASSRLRLRIINRESVPERVYRGELRVSPVQRHIHVLPDQITAALSTVPLPTATVAAAEGGIDFGQWRIGDEGPSEATVQVEFSAGARSGESGFYVDVTSASTTVAPSVAWNGRPVGPGDRLTSTERLNELAFSWLEAPAEDGGLAGEVRLTPEGLALEGPGLVSDDQGRVATPWRLQVNPPPLTWWQRALYVLGVVAVLIFLLIFVLMARYRRGPYTATRLFFVGVGMADPRLHGKLVYEPPGSDPMEVPLSGPGPMLVGAGGDYLLDLPDQVELVPRYRDKKERVIARCTQGDVQYRSDDDYNTQPLDGQSLNSHDVLVMSGREEVVFWEC